MAHGSAQRGPRIAVVIPTIRPHTLRSAVASIVRQSWADWELCLVAQGQDRELETLTARLREEDPRVRVIWLEQGNLSAARNAGISATSSEIVAFLDDDCEADAEWLATMLRLFDEHPQVGVLGGNVIAPPAERRFAISTCPTASVLDTWYQPRENGFRAPEGFYLIGANFAIRRSIIDRVGPFDTSLGAGTHYPACEDVDFYLRAEAADIALLSNPKLVVHHTYGRRYGLRAFLKHHQNYARGRGALGIKLMWMQHRLAAEWGAPRKLRQLIRPFLSNPPRFLLYQLYGGLHERIGAKSFAREHELRSDRTCARRMK